MSELHGSHPGQPTSAEDWDERYSADPVWSGNPNHALVTEASDLTPGTALDVGCGEGADAVWLARRGWRVTALDISPKAVARTLAAAETAGVTVTGVAGAFLQAAPADPFDLVSCMFPVLDKTPDHVVEERLADLVAPGGTLLFVHHELDAEHLATAREHGFQPEKLLSPTDVAAWFASRDGWRITTERRERPATNGAGSHHHVDLVVRVERP